MNEPVVRPIISDTVLLVVAVGMALAFLSLLVFDFVRRRRHKRRHAHGSHPHGSRSSSGSHGPAEDWRTKLRKPLDGFREIRRAFEHLARRRARRQRHYDRMREAEERRRETLPPQR